MNTLRETAKIVGLSISQIQKYEQAGLSEKPTTKNKAGHLLYDDTAIERLLLLHHYHDLGYTIPEIRQLLARSATEENEIISRAIKARQKELAAEAKKLLVMEEMRENGLTPSYMNQCVLQEFRLPYDVTMACLTGVFDAMQAYCIEDCFADIPIQDAFLDALSAQCESLVAICRTLPPESEAVQAQVQKLHAVISDYLCDALCMFRVFVMLLAPGRELAPIMDELFGKDAAVCMHAAGLYYVDSFTKNNPFSDRNLFAALDNLWQYFMEGASPSEARVQQNVHRIYGFFAQIKFLSPQGGHRILEQMATAAQDAMASAFPDNTTLSDFVRRFSEAIALYLKNQEGE